jgi:hypothetical protein
MLELLGHKSLETVYHYTRLTIDDPKETHGKCHPLPRTSTPPRNTPGEQERTFPRAGRALIFI